MTNVTVLNSMLHLVLVQHIISFHFCIDVNIALRKIAVLLKPDKDIAQTGDHMIIKTISSFRNYLMEFDIGKEFPEDLTGIDDRQCMTTVNWDGDKLVCVQVGEKQGRGWTQWVEGDELHLTTGWHSYSVVSPTASQCQLPGFDSSLQHLS
ncbi:retinol-binding protein 1, partial [Rhincodon typus]|uniref:retinol-binding protein 1 n=1 Tax=Rhincodon typus TaxID=259920 RepID=UPI002030C082